MNYDALKPTLINTIVEEINSDDECIEKKAEQLLDLYENASTSEQTIVNELFITLTGWSFESLIEKAQNF